MVAAASRVVGVALRDVAARSDLFQAGKRLVVGFSGGQDSTCLLHALVEMGRAVDFEVVATHVDHGLRADSGADAARAVDIARGLGVRAVARRVDVGAYRRRLRQWSIQQAARAARYQALAQVVAEVDADALMVAHTADDQAETVLLNLLRGSGLAGLAGMRLDETISPARLGPAAPELGDRPVPVPERLRLVRPLLRIERRTTLAYCAELALPIVADASNLSRAYTRNRVRLDVLPVLEQLNPAVRTVLARTADLVADEQAALDGVARTLHASLARPAGRRTLAYDRSAWESQPRGLQRRLLRLGIETLTGGLEDVPAGSLEDALDVLRAGRAGRAYHLPRNVELTVLEQRLLLQVREPAPGRQPPFPSAAGGPSV